MSNSGRGHGVVAVAVGALLLLAVAGSAEAQLKAASAEVKAVTGQVEIQQKGQTHWTPAVIGAKLAEGDHIRAHAAGSAILGLPDGSTLFVAENSRAAVTKLEVDQQNQGRNVLLHLVVGKVRAIVAKSSISLVRARQSNFAITTPTAVAAVRGTDFEVVFNDIQQTMRVAVLPEPPEGSRPGAGSL